MIDWNMAYAKQVYEIDHKHKKRLKTERDQKLKQKEVLKNALENQLIEERMKRRME